MPPPVPDPTEAPHLRKRRARSGARSRALCWSLALHGAAVAAATLSGGRIDRAGGTGPAPYRLALGELAFASVASLEAEPPAPEPLEFSGPEAVPAAAAEASLDPLPPEAPEAEPLATPLGSQPPLDLERRGRPARGAAAAEARPSTPEQAPSESHAEAAEAPAERAEETTPPAQAPQAEPAEEAASPPASSAGGGSGQPVLLEAPEPVYPPRAIQLRKQGSVLIAVELGADGRVQAAVVLESSGFEPLDQAALEAIRRWRFEPGSGTRFEHRFRFELGGPQR